jgi:SAM-dependent methyltransferase
LLIRMIEQSNGHGVCLGKYVVRMLHMLLKRYGNARAKKKVWDAEFSGGKWDFLEMTTLDPKPKDPIYWFIHKYSGLGSILDLGCGTGKTGFEVDADKYRSYTGVDISGVAIERAFFQCRSIPERATKNEYVVADIEDYAPKRKYRIILFRESIYYVSRSGIPRMLRRLAGNLDEGGVFIVRMFDQRRFKSITRAIERNFRVLEKYSESGGGTIILVFK